MEIFASISPVQWVFIGLGLLIALPALIPNLKLDSILKNIKPNPSPPAPSNHNDHDLTDLVCKWECLCNACHEAGIHEACDMLEEVFPLLSKVRKSKPHTPKEDNKNE
jgi:hypothetical protein